MNEEEKPLTKWLSPYRKKNTKTLYLSAAKHFFNCIYSVGVDRPFDEYEKLAAWLIMGTDPPCPAC
jgi:hypothetical protein